MSYLREAFTIYQSRPAFTVSYCTSCEEEMKIYVAGPITGQKPSEVLERWDTLTNALSPDFTVLSPLVGKMKLFRTEEQSTPLKALSEPRKKRPKSVWA